MRREVFVFVLLTVLVKTSHGFKCYTCTMSGGDKDQACLKNPDAVSTSNPITTCNKKYCTIHRIEYIDSGEIYSFSRDCEESPTAGITTDSEFVTYVRKCTSSLCNNWDGKASSSGGSDGGNSGGGSGGNGGGNGPINGGDDSTLLIVPGIGGSASTYTSSLLYIFISILCALLFL